MKRIILLTLLLCSCTPRFQVILPKSTWEPNFFRSINERAKLAELPSLRTPLPKNDLEMRLWIGFGLSELEGFAIKRTSGNWSAIYMNGVHPQLAREDYQKQLGPPKSGWDEFWRRLVANEILTLPDAYEIDCRVGGLDGVSYVVEVNHQFTYRTYMYDFPSLEKCEQAKMMVRTFDLTFEEFDLYKVRIPQPGEL